MDISILGTNISLLRAAGILCGTFIILLTLNQGRRRPQPKLNLLMQCLFGVLVVTFSAYPGAATLILGPFALSEGTGFPRIIGLLIGAVIFLMIYQIVLTSNLADDRRNLTTLVRELSIREYLNNVDHTSNADVLIAVPAYNEEKSLADVLASVPREIKGLRTESVVIIDGATDNTEGVARRFGVPVVHPINRGQPAAWITGYEIAKRRGIQIVATIDADGQLLTEDLEKVIEPILEGRADLVNGSRVLGNYYVDNWIRGLGVNIFANITSFFIRQRITDTSNGLRAISTAKLSLLRLHEERLGGAVELLIEAHRRGLRILEVPVTVRARTAGETKKGRTFHYGFWYGLAMIRSWLR